MRYIKEIDVLYVMNLLESGVGFDLPPELTLRSNLKNRPCFRCDAQTNSKTWAVDIYGKHFFYVMCPPYPPKVFDSVRGLILYLRSIVY